MKRNYNQFVKNNEVKILPVITANIVTDVPVIEENS